MYVQCITCSSTYHAHCYREKAHSLCQKCRAQVMNISQTSSPTTDSKVENESKDTTAVLNESSTILPNIGDSDSKSSATRTAPKVTIAPIKSSRSLIQSTKNAPLITGNNGSGGKNKATACF
ncbi:hypothetical protein BLA29_011859 [Euroglyphus maynei]|uniref:Uncharacterized protein n=1 Tax=Euroglyphus maynei TaxID=6958 RepID=A0A1Y3B6B8_EURMA|nr:hypothetical protein BLA29_011859 [Euroglyphus maynei]